MQECEEVHFIYNETYSLEGEELGDSIERIFEWGEREGLMFRNAQIIRKNFGWVSHQFRKGYERTVAISILRHLMEHGLSNSAEMSAPDLERIVASSHEDFEGFWDCSPEAWQEIYSGAIALPFLFEGGIVPWLKSLQGKVVEVSGGFRHRCLDEICMMLEASGISYHLNESIIYSLPEEAAETPEADAQDFQNQREDFSPRFFTDFGLLTV